MTNAEFNKQFCERTFEFARNIVFLIERLPYNTVTKKLGYQLCGSGTSVAANWRAFCRARSKNELFAKVCIVVEEADETVFWLQLLSTTSFGDKQKIQDLIHEASELLRITSTIKNKLYPPK